jgi:hypothetical protein
MSHLQFRVELNPKTILIASAGDRKNLCKILAAATGGCLQPRDAERDALPSSRRKQVDKKKPRRAGVSL